MLCPALAGRKGILMRATSIRLLVLATALGAGVALSAQQTPPALVSWQEVLDGLPADQARGASAGLRVAGGALRSRAPALKYLQ